jgi:hypothetical protein
MIKKKRGISALVGTVLLILITIASVSIVFGAVIPMIKRINTESQLCVTAHLIVNTQSGFTCYDSQNKLLGVMVSRGKGEVDLSGVSILIDSGDGDRKKIIKNQSLPEINSASVYVLDVSEFNGVVKISIAPIIKNGNKDKECGISSSVNLIPDCAFPLELTETPEEPEEEYCGDGVVNNGEECEVDEDCEEGKVCATCICEIPPECTTDEDCEEEICVENNLYLLAPICAEVIGTYSGAGTVENPYEITNIYQLQCVKDKSLSANYILMKDIDASVTSAWNSGAGFIPIGTFSGIFNGQGYLISDLYINRPATNYVGLFNITHNKNSNISYVGLANVNITGNSYVGAIVGHARGYVYDCYSSGQVKGYEMLGGIAGQISYFSVYEGTLKNCYSNVNVTSTVNYRPRGGLLGTNSYGKVINCYSTGQILPIGGTWGSGLVGTIQSTGAYEDTNNFWDTETSGWSTSLMGTGKTTAEMKSISTFTNWNIAEINNYINEIWKIDNLLDYPRLGWES